METVKGVLHNHPGWGLTEKTRRSPSPIRRAGFQRVKIGPAPSSTDISIRDDDGKEMRRTVSENCDSDAGSCAAIGIGGMRPRQVRSAMVRTGGHGEWATAGSVLYEIARRT